MKITKNNIILIIRLTRPKYGYCYHFFIFHSMCPLLSRYRKYMKVSSLDIIIIINNNIMCQN